ncbi:hypothetical protein D6817_01480 [Candidatus Pacearchaeota archaeon]|nr:MAG: hypothetical protein D6817_01480 [Candidatus Pacearchaeota archaeon]
MKKEVVICWAVVFIVLSLLLVGNVFAQPASQPSSQPASQPSSGTTLKEDVSTFGTRLKEFFGSTLGLGPDAQASPTVAKILFLIILTLLVWSILDMSGIVTNSAVKWGLSIVVSLLGILYLTPEEIWATVGSYSAMGMTLLFVFPIIILFFFTFRIIIQGGAMGYIVQQGVWAIYFLFLLFNFFIGFVSDRIGGFSDPKTWVYLVVILVAFVMTFFNGTIRKLISENFIEAEVQAARNVITSAVEIDKLRKQELEGLGRGS